MACPFHDRSVWPECATCPGPADPPTRRRRLHDILTEQSAGMCEWPYCADPGEEMAHITHRGMGGSRQADWLGNVAWLCRRHHDMLDGRTALGTLRADLNETLRAHLAHVRGTP